jgi:hypothetical protein
MLKQTAESPDRRRVLHAGDERSLVELGTFQDLIFEHDLRRSLEFDLAWSLPEPLRFVDALQGDKPYQVGEIGFEARVVTHKGSEFVHGFTYRLRENTIADSSMSVGMQRGRGQQYELSATGYPLVRTPGRASPLPSPMRFYGFPDEVVAR